MENKKQTFVDRVANIGNADEIHCAICGGLLNPNNSINNPDCYVEIRRGYFHNSDIDEGDNDAVFCDDLKFNDFLCLRCFMDDPDVCRLMNKMGDRIR